MPQQPHRRLWKVVRSLLPFAFCLLLSAFCAAADWTQWRGPGGSGVSPEADLPVQWSATENLRWKVELPGRGLSSPVIAGDRVYLTARSGQQQQRLHVLCFDLATGAKRWERQFWATGTTVCHQKTCMAAPTPATDGERVYALFGSHDLVCLDRDGNLGWFRSLTRDYPTVGNNVGMASSPLLWRDVLLLALENAGESFAAAIDKHTGQNRWRVERPRGINWVTPLLAANDGREEVLYQSASDLASYDPATGKQLWSYTHKPMATIASPVAGGGLVFVPGPRLFALRPGSAQAAPQFVWDTNKLPTGYASPLVHEGRVYALATGGILNCAEAATGKALWSERLEGPFAASPLLAGGKLYVVNEEGVTTVFQLQGQGRPRVLGTNAVADKILASPVAADGALFLRSDGYLYCIGGKKAG